jgi:hypothetical protein
MTMTDVRLRATDPGRWDAYVATHPGATPFHLAAFLTTAGRCLGLRTTLALAEDGGRVVGAVPLLVRSKGPFALVNDQTPVPYLGPLLAPGYRLETVLPAVRRFLRPQPLLRFAVQTLDPFPAAPAGPGWSWESDFDSEVVAVDPADDDDALFALFSSSRRSKLRRALRAGLTVGPATREEIAELLPRWSAEAFAKQGLPPHWPDGAHAAFYDALVPSGVGMPSAVRRGEEVLLVSFDLCAAGRLVGWEIGNGDAGRAADASLVMYFHLLCTARDRGIPAVDLLGAPTEAIAAYKRSLGAGPRPRGVARWDSPLLPMGRKLMPQQWLRPVGAPS